MEKKDADWRTNERNGQSRRNFLRKAGAVGTIGTIGAFGLSKTDLFGSNGVAAASDMDESKVPVPQYTIKHESGSDGQWRSDLSTTVGWFGSYWIDSHSEWLHDVRFNTLCCSAAYHDYSDEWDRNNNIKKQYYNIEPLSDASIHLSADENFSSVYPNTSSDSKDYTSEVGSLIIAGIGAWNAPLGLSLTVAKLGLELSESYTESYNMTHKIRKCVLWGIYCWREDQNEMTHARSFYVQTPGNETGWGSTESVRVKTGAKINPAGPATGYLLDVEFKFGLAGEDPDYISRLNNSSEGGMEYNRLANERPPKNTIPKEGPPLRDIPQNPNYMSEEAKAKLGVAKVDSAALNLDKKPGLREYGDITHVATNLPVTFKRENANQTQNDNPNLDTEESTGYTLM